MSALSDVSRPYLARSIARWDSGSSASLGNAMRAVRYRSRESRHVHGGLGGICETVYETRRERGDD